MIKQFFPYQNIKNLNNTGINTFIVHSGSLSITHQTSDFSSMKQVNMDMKKDIKVLFMQNNICTRAWKEAKALTQKGISVSLVELDESTDNMDYSIFHKHFHIPLKKKYTVTRLPYAKYVFIKHLKKILKEHEFDLIHSHNSPDVYAVWIKRSSNLPVVHDIHDIASLVTYEFFSNNAANQLFRLARLYWELIACNICDAILSPTQETKDYLDKKYNIRRSAFVNNKPIKQDVIVKEKLSKRDGQVHLVYEGGLSEIEKTERNMMPIFNEIGSWEGYQVHIYSKPVGRIGLEKIEEQIKYPNKIHMHQPLPLDKLLTEMTQYDYGLCLFPIMTGNLRRASANKTYEYQISGLPIINNLEGHTWKYIKEKGCGRNIHKIKDIKKIVKEKNEYNLDTGDCFINIDTVLELYEKVLE